MTAQAQAQRQRQARMTPRKFATNHCHVSFGPRNEIITICGSRVVIQSLEQTIFESTPESTRECVSCWPGPLVVNNNAGHHHDREQDQSLDVLEWIKSREEQPISFEMRLILKVITMLVKQSGKISGADLAEVLVDNLINDNFNVTILNGANNSSVVGNSVAMSGDLDGVDSQGGDNSLMSIMEKPIDQLRRHLMKGQRKVS